MSTKSTIAYMDSKNGNYHLYSEVFSDMIYLDYSQGLNMQVSVAIPLKFAIEMSTQLSEHLAQIKSLLEASDEELRVRAKIAWEKQKGWAATANMPWMRTMLGERSDEQGIQDSYESLKETQAKYLELMNEQGTPEVSQ